MFNITESRKLHYINKLIQEKDKNKYTTLDTEANPQPKTGIN